MTPNRSTPVRCAYRGCPCIGHFAAYDGRCPMHRTPEFDTPHPPTLAQAWDVDDGGPR